jgi:hypothetical protein
MTPRALVGTLSLAVCATVLSAQTRVTAPDNKYSPAEDVELGREAAAQARQQLPILSDDRVASYVESLGRKLTATIRSDLRHPEFRYTFQVVNVRDINAFALPGGPMFVNRGMIEAARSEGEVAGVLAHELSHVVLRHGTAQASRATPFQIGELAGAILGTIVGGRAGSAIATGTSFGLGTMFMKYGREYERQADIEGAHMMARAGYDPREMANMFRTIQQQSASGGPEWLSDHPNPGNRSQYITQEAAALRVENPARDTRAFEQVRARLKGMPRAPTTEEATKNTRGTTRDTTAGTTGVGARGRVERPSTRYTEYREGGVFRVSVPSNWRELPASNAVTFAPDGGHGTIDGRPVFTHGIEIGLARNETHDLRTATEELIQSLSEQNPQMTRPSSSRSISLAGRRGLQTALSNVSEATGQRETIRIVTALVGDGTLFYTIAVAPADEYSAYQQAFSRIVESIRLESQ